MGHPVIYSGVFFDPISVLIFFDSRVFRLKYTAPSISLYVRAHRFWVLQDVGHCEGDACWSELAFPFTHHRPDGVTTGARFN